MSEPLIPATSTAPTSMAHAGRTAPARNAQAVWATGVALADVLVLFAAVYGASVGYHLFAYGTLPDLVAYDKLSLGLAVFYGGLCLGDDQYDLSGERWNEHGITRGLAALGLAFVFLLAAVFMIDGLDTYSRGTFLTQLAVAAPAQVVGRTVLSQIVEHARRSHRWPRTRAVVLTFPGAAGAAPNLGALRHAEILRTFALAGSDVAELDARIASIRTDCRSLGCDAVLLVFDADSMDLVARAVAAFSELPVRIQLLPVGLADYMRRSRVAPLGRLRVLELFSRPSTLLDRLLKRGLDLLVASIAGILLLPLMVMVAIAVKLNSRGPVLFRQTRHGFNNEPISVLKFRTMTTLENGEGEFRQAVRDDPRVTRVGRILRRSNIDELPQLLNVLRGDMSVVGPRPHAVAHNALYADQIRHMSRRHNVKPGITGWAQVNGLRGETDTFEKMRQRVELDLYYVDNWSLLFDVRILIMTVFSSKAYANAY